MFWGHIVTTHHFIPFLYPFLSSLYLSGKLKHTHTHYYWYLGQPTSSSRKQSSVCVWHIRHISGALHPVPTGTFAHTPVLAQNMSGWHSRVKNMKRYETQIKSMSHRPSTHTLYIRHLLQTACKWHLCLRWCQFILKSNSQYFNSFSSVHSRLFMHSHCIHYNSKVWDQ